MHEFVNTIVTLPEPLHIALIAVITLALGWGVAQIAALWPWLADFLGQYVEEVSVVAAGAIVTYLNSLLAQIPSGWEAVANSAFALILAVLAALGVITQFRKAREAIAIRALDRLIEEL